MSADELRSRGNDYFKKSMFHNAIDSYTKSLEVAVTALTLANRAQAHLKLSHFESAYADADAAVLADGDYAKARFRRATAALKLGFPKRAKKDCELLLKEEPNNKDFVKLMDDIKNAKKVATVELRHANKCETIRSEKPLKNIDIEQTEVIKQVQDEQKAETSEKPFVVPAPAKTASQFLADFASMKERDPQYFGKYLLSMNVQRLPTILDTFLESDMIAMIIRGLRAVEAETPKEDIGEILVAVSMTPRFDLAAMFLDSDDKKIVQEMLRKLPKEKETFLSQRYL